ncbi:hypothetical protein PTSG_12093 [Salpingoeca rosetta]|uniref:Saccharopine dehydrogenase NADP binding domain-containing protein n=1 Tax=Salpingoeca rosetta (strain ATCC 50818 / BSB-021) TaxID=946362 RepID=F2U775_SALR5|nr:uncharacterized protein PTSG_12093 [Salpingoeca rosetta]EGD83292.1 hypothetical protein PTSG_12093 [Salpingoeca rosetta]|eukprot:XP_004994796.1 hypothetical protein PTSG_12093 [Salpingoeca rosetta]
MSEAKKTQQPRAVDIVVFGATGFTGQYVVQYLRGTVQDKSIAISGRSADKLAALNRKLGTNYPVIVADVKDEESIVAMAQQARVCLNCVGPYRFFGEPVVKACAAVGTHYLDICGEPEFIERMEYLYDEQARQTGATIISACGFDSIPADLGTMFTVKQFTNGQIPSSVESFLQIKSGEAGTKVHFATFESAVHGFASAGELRDLRRKKGKVTVPVVGRKLKRPGMLPEWREDGHGYCIPFPGSDASIVRRSQQYLQAHGAEVQPVQYAAWFSLPSGFWTGVMMAAGTVFGALANFSFGRSLLLKFPELFTLGVFTHDGPTEEQMRATSFEMNFVAKGYTSAAAAEARGAPDVTVKTRVSGPEPGYVATPICIVQCALALIGNEGKVPRGVLTSATAFRHTDILQRLNGAGVKFEVL